MSAAAAAAPARSSGGGLQRRLGPLPAWGWLALASVAGLGYWYYKRQQTASAANAAAAGAAVDTSSGTSSDVSPDGAYEGTALDDLESFLAAQDAAGTSGGTTTKTAAPTYRLVTTKAGIQSALKNHIPLYIKGASGAYTPYRGTKIPSGLPVYIQVGSAAK